MGARRTAAGATAAVQPGHVVTPSHSSSQSHSSIPRSHELSSLSDSECRSKSANAGCCPSCILDTILVSMFTVWVESHVRYALIYSSCELIRYQYAVGLQVCLRQRFPWIRAQHGALKLLEGLRTDLRLCNSVHSRTLSTHTFVQF